MDNVLKNEFSKNFARILKGSAVSLVSTIVLLFIFAIILTFTNVQENTIVPVVITISTISILLGSVISTLKIKKNGLINGGVVGLIYIVSIYILSSITGSGFSLSINSIIMMLACIIGGMLGRNNRCKYKIKT